MKTQFQLFNTLSDPIIVFEKKERQVIFKNHLASNFDLAQFDFEETASFTTEDGRCFEIQRNSTNDHIFLHFKEKTEVLNLEQKFTDFVYIASHDLREPARKIVTFGERLRTVINPDKDPKALAYLERMETSSHRLQKMLDDLLIFSRIKKQDQKPVDLVVILNQALEVKNLDFPIENDENTTIQGSEEQLKVVFEHILDNSLKFNVNDKPTVKIAIHKNGNSVIVEIQDNGIGLDPEDFEKAFKPFVRLNGRSAFTGSGMGLAIAKKIIENHHGTIQFVDTSEGSCLKIELPIAR